MATDPSGIPVPDPTETLARVVESTAQLIATAEQFDDAAVREPSLLPGWTRGHVLTHVARNAEAVGRLLTWAATGEETPMYASPEARDAEIEAGAGRTAAELLADVRLTGEHFAVQAARLTEEQWQNEIMGRRGGKQQAGWLPWWRLEEILIHHVDLNVAYSPAHWPEYFTEPELQMIAARFSNPVFTPESPAFRLLSEDEDGTDDRVYGVLCAPEDAGVPIVRGPSAALVAWLIGRSNGDGLNVEPHGPLPQPPAWK
ncbi:maleylpyruvate isomerase family mycothiol-dependent enzyme [Actinospica sp. MGRD01-02]|uniref:Maleylpyruvate isomerase family mycothiol-dependent enzyme n=1 Tax=Actinospica acidithermotolerans TaxID=2828514 RepID=A0A941E6A0_9ACTN|nr:maleylpyruvate isomerase family mycothiol-dependent enzyme [Actinospica acidithermotolerans]MBR7825227.1 maleylpyruvate isomerase family mycothiol-dependent enzyme [Actinospica acidithermotolerans]